MKTQIDLTPGIQLVEENGKKFEVAIRPFPDTLKEILSNEERKNLWKNFYRICEYENPIIKQLEGPIQIHIYFRPVFENGGIDLMQNWFAKIKFDFQSDEYKFDKDMLNKLFNQKISFSRKQNGYSLISLLEETTDFEDVILEANHAIRETMKHENARHLRYELLKALCSYNKSQLIDLIGEDI